MVIYFTITHTEHSALYLIGYTVSYMHKRKETPRGTVAVNCKQ